MNPNVDQYLVEGCMRCKYGGTPDCKVNTWREHLKLLRNIVIDCGLTEDFKWKQPCYTYNDRNVLLVTAFKEFATISFFKGALLSDGQGLMAAPGDNSQAYRQLRFTSIDQILELEAEIRAYIFEAIEIEKAGLKINFAQKEELVYPEELTEILNKDARLKEAFENLTPGRQRGYILFFSAAKQSQTRKTRIEKYIPNILMGKGMQDR
ncbi:MAG TPA: YdeI/OmpD-associated family protein [Bacteroidales bacterium]|nr:YdeI/OmpD-associated family protein [Bacteroidales bacterium]HRX95673.1 YdeI/OmpD-associated family protein [Bacteroidales bacterium]